MGKMFRRKMYAVLVVLCLILSSVGVFDSSEVHAKTSKKYVYISQMADGNGASVTVKGNKIILNAFYGNISKSDANLTANTKKYSKRTFQADSKCKVKVWGDEADEDADWDVYSLKKYTKTFGKTITGPVLFLNIKNNKVTEIVSTC